MLPTQDTALELSLNTSQVIIILPHGGSGGDEDQLYIEEQGRTEETY